MAVCPGCVMQGFDQKRCAYLVETGLAALVVVSLEVDS